MKIATRLLAAGMFLGALGFGGTAGAQSIDTTGGANKYEVGPFGVPDTSTYGQTFTVGASNYLASYSLYLTGSTGSAISFKSYVYAWDGSKATGAALFSSATQQFTSGTDTAFTFNPGVSLTSGSKYVAFLTTAGLQSGQADRTVEMPLVNSSTYAGGDFVFYNTGDDFAALTTTNWDCNEACGFGDAFFKASFTATPIAAAAPEPGTWGMMILGFGAVGFAMRRRQKVATRVSYAA